MLLPMIEGDDIRLSELLCARLCHDLASPMGAAAAGLELLEDCGDAETAALVAAGMATATARLKFLRAALGPAAEGAQSPEALAELADAYLGGAVQGGIALDWRCDRSRLDGATARLLLNLVLIARDALPRGGRIAVRVTGAGAGDLGLMVEAEGQGAGPSAEAAPVLLDGGPPAGPRGAQAWYARRLAEGMGTSLVVQAAPGHFSAKA